MAHHNTTLRVSAAIVARRCHGGHRKRSHANAGEADLGNHERAATPFAETTGTVASARVRTQYGVRASYSSRTGKGVAVAPIG